jgi:FkbM family methyltransferase
MDASKPALDVRLRRFLARPTREKYWAIHRRVIAYRFRNPNAFRLWFGCYWLPEGSALDYALSSGGFEVSECRLVSRLLGSGMTVVDVGAHHGLYSLLLSKRVGPRGRVFAFEPSPRERARLEKHLRANRCRNVSVHPFALGSKSGSGDLFLVDGAEDYCNSLRPPAVSAATGKIRIEVTSLDEFLEHADVHHVDFLKLDVEGAELDVLKGARRTLGVNPKPILLVEVFDLRTQAWGYKANEIVRFLYRAGYEWLRISGDETLEPVSPDLDVYDANLLAVPSGDGKSSYTRSLIMGRRSNKALNAT